MTQPKNQPAVRCSAHNGELRPICDVVATHLVTLVPSCGCVNRPSLYCEWHATRFVNLQHKGKCPHCGAWMTAFMTEPVPVRPSSVVVR